MIDFAAAREAMVDRQVRPSDVTLYPIIEAMLAVPREDFVPAAWRPVAYLGEHVPIAPGRVLLDPRVFAKLLDALNPGPTDLVLDLGCGYGYSTAVLGADGRGGGRARGGPGPRRRGRGAARARTRSTTPWCRPGRSRPASPSTGRSTRSSSRARSRSLPEAIAAQLKPGGRIAAIFADGAGGQARLGLRTEAGHRPGGVSSMPRRRCFPASTRRKRLSSEPIRPIVPARKPGRQRAIRCGAAPGDDNAQAPSETLAADAAPLAALLPRRRRAPSRWPTRWSRPTRPARCSTSNRAALRGLDESVPQARAQRRPQVGVGVSGLVAEPTSSRIPEEQLNSLQAALNAELAALRPRPDQGGDRVGAQHDRRRPRRPQGRRAARAVQRRRRPTSTCCRTRSSCGSPTTTSTG